MNAGQRLVNSILLPSQSPCVKMNVSCGQIRGLFACRRVKSVDFALGGHISPYPFLEAKVIVGTDTVN